VFHTRTALANGLRELLKRLEEKLLLRAPVNVYLAGGQAALKLNLRDALALAHRVERERVATAQPDHVITGI
jgi:hypothetical protein